MATLPENDIDILELEVESQPGLTWNIDTETMRISGEINGIEAVRQAAEIILNIERYRWQIFDPSSGVQLEELIGHDKALVGSELNRRITDALKMDDRIIGISDFTYSTSGNNLSASFTINTVYGDFVQEMEVSF